MPVTKGAERRWNAKKFILKLEKFRALFWLGGGGEHNKDQVDQKKKKNLYISAAKCLNSTFTSTMEICQQCVSHFGSYSRGLIFTH